MNKAQLHRYDPDTAGALADLPTDGLPFFPEGKEAAKASFKQLRDELITLQRALYAEGRHKVLIIFQAMDAGGKDGTIRNVCKGVNPQGVRVHSFKEPTPLELAHDFLWRIHQAAPPSGMIAVFNRSHYEDVLVVRVDKIVPESVWRPRYEHINAFEKMLADSGTTILKFFLHISPDEQKERFQARLDEPDKHWKFSFGDLEKRRQWSDYMAAYEEMLSATSTAHAPWFIIPADRKWYRNLAVTRTIVDTIRSLDPRYPQAEGDMIDVVIPDV